MSNIFHEIKRGFLVLGFTGPLSSGCTTAARFFEKEINAYIEKRFEKALPKIESDIRRKYKALEERKAKLGQRKANKHELYKEINRLSYELKEKLKIRETLTVLSQYRNTNFKYISMTDMLLKLTLEYISDENEENLKGNILKLKKILRFDNFKLAKAKEVSIQIRNRELSDIKKVDMEIYEDFLAYISSYRAKLKDYFSVDELGELLQDLGDNARRCGNPVDFRTQFKKNNAKTLFSLAEEGNNTIKFYRNRKRKDLGKEIYNEFVIEAFRNPYEIEYFRNRYYEFYLFSIYAPLQTRKARGNYNKTRDERDRGRRLKPAEFYKQKVSECVYLSDIAINNDSEKKFILERKLAKYFALICRPGCISPTDDEVFMQQAYCMSVKSHCISRQVGAVIVGPRRYIIGAGWNDVGAGQIPCGLRRYSDVDKNDNLFPVAIKGEEGDFSKALEVSGKDFPDHSFCFKDEYSQFETDKKVMRLKRTGNSLNKWVSEYGIEDRAVEALSKLAVSDLSPKRLEYCRALHAEENAILQSAIIGGIGIEGATIYTTTFPCELCAKKIYQSRIRKVVYTEPYPESIAEHVFFKDGSHSIELSQFEGVKSHSYYRLFKSPVDKKEFQLQERLY